MTVEEFRAIREKKSLEIVGMNGKQLHEYFKKGADAFEKDVYEMRKKDTEMEKEQKKNNIYS